MVATSGGSPPTAARRRRSRRVSAAASCGNRKGASSTQSPQGDDACAQPPRDRSTTRPAMLPTLALVGRPNVGKSTLFNRLTKSRNALVADVPGLTRDRHYGRARAGEREYLVVDTGGFEPVATAGILFEMAKQTRTAIAECDAVIFVVDARAGVTPQDVAIGELLRSEEHTSELQS